MTGAHGDAVGVEQRGNVVGVQSLHRECDDRAPRLIG